MSKRVHDIIVGIIMLLCGITAIVFPVEGRWLAGLILVAGGVKSLWGDYRNLHW